jgi:imidazolonepropionase-like amidohydrolase
VDVEIPDTWRSTVISVRLLPLLLIPVFVSAFPLSCSGQERTIITNVDVITMTSEEVLENRDVIIVGERIVAVAETGKTDPEDDDSIIDGTGQYLIPGLADMHVHLYVFEDGAELPLYIANGVTTIKDCNGRDHILAFRDEIAEGKRIGPRIYCSTHTIRGFEDEPWDLVGERYGKGYDAVKFYSYFDSRQSFNRAMTEAKRLDAYTLGHIPYTVGLDGIIEEGMDEIAHVEEICWEFADFDRDQSLAPDAWLKLIVASYIEKYGDMGPEELRAALAEKASECARKIAGEDIIVSTTCHYNVVIDKKIFETAEFARNPAFKYLPPEYFLALGLGREKHQAQFKGIEHLTGTWSTMLGTMLLALREEGVLLTAGTDAIWYMGLVPGYSLHDELDYFVEIGFTPYEALKTATANAGEAGRRIDGLDQVDFGTIESGKRADLVLLGGNPLEDISNTRDISGVMANGTWFSREDIEAMLAFDPEVHRAQLDLFEAGLALREGDAGPLDEFASKTGYEEAKECIYGNRRTVAELIMGLHAQNMDDRAASHFDTAVKANWDDVNFLNALCWDVAVENKFEKLYPAAIAATKRALELNRHPAILDTLAWLYALSGDYGPAIKAIEEAQSLDPDSEVYRETHDRIVEMKGG